MSIAERKLKEKEEMHTLILNGARKVFLRMGYEAASIRNIAKEISYSPSSIYFYFKEKGLIFHELQEEGFRLLLSKNEVLGHVSDPFERLKAMCGVFIDFAINNKDFYNLMFIVEPPIKKDKDDNKKTLGNKALQNLVDVVKECIDAGRFKNMDADNLSFTILSSLHGMSSMFCKDRTSTFTNKSSEQLIKDGSNTLISILERL